MTSIRSNTSSDLLVGNDGRVAVSRHRRWLQRVALLTAAALASTFGLVGVGPAAAQAADGFVAIDAVPLGAAASFGALTPDAAFTSTGATTFRGDTGSTTYSFVGGGHSGTSFVGTTYDGAFDNFVSAYSDAAGRKAGSPLIPRTSAG